MRRRKILIVEDDTGVADFYRYLLESKGALAVVASSAEAAKRWIEEEKRFDLAILDLGLPEGKDAGIGLCQFVKTNPATCDMPVIIASAATGNLPHVYTAAAGADMHLAKPVKADEFWKAIEVCLRLKVAGTFAGVLLLTGGFKVDPADASVEYLGRRVALSRELFRLAYALARYHPKPLQRAAILGNFSRKVVRDRQVDVRVCRLRRLFKDAFGQRLIVTAPPAAYRLDFPQKSAVN
ncbi:MAG: response regulator [Elusimicrobiota bacterium]